MIYMSILIYLKMSTLTQIVGEIFRNNNKQTKKTNSHLWCLQRGCDLAAGEVSLNMTAGARKSSHFLQVENQEILGNFMGFFVRFREGKYDDFIYFPFLSTRNAVFFCCFDLRRMYSYHIC